MTANSEAQAEMKKYIATMAVVTALLTVGVSAAQPPAPLRDAPRRPVYSPYLNLNRGGGTTTQNYFGLVRPEIEFRNNVNQLRRDTQAISTGMAAPPPDADLETGHSTGYMTHLRFFGTNGSGRAAARPAASNAGAPPPSRRGR